MDAPEYKRVSITFDQADDRTQQQFADDSDVNIIVARATRGTGLPQPSGLGPTRLAQYGDFTEIGDLGEVYRRWDEAQELFYSLPATVRDMGGNDIQTFQQRLEDPGFRQAVEARLNPRASAAPAPPQAPAEGPTAESPPSSPVGAPPSPTAPEEPL